MLRPLHARTCQSQLSRFHVTWDFLARFGILALAPENLCGMAFDAEPMGEGGHLVEIVGFLSVLAGIIAKTLATSLALVLPPPPIPRLVAVTLSPRLLPIPSVSSA